MAKHVIPITNGVGSLELVNDVYTVTSETIGYVNTSIVPSSQEITEGVNEYSFTISATGTLTIHVSDDGTDVGVPIVGATFVRCDSEGNNYGDAIVSDDDGNAVFNYVPFDVNAASNIYYKQTTSDGRHTFDDTLKTTTLAESTGTIEIGNPEAPTRTFNLTDTNYSGLPIEAGSIGLE